MLRSFPSIPTLLSVVFVFFLIMKGCWILSNTFSASIETVYWFCPSFCKCALYIVWIWELDYKESWMLKNWCFWTVVLEKTLESPLDCKEIQPVHPKGDQSWVFIGGIDVEAETPVLWPPGEKNWLIWKIPDVGKDSGQKEKRRTEDEMVGCPLSQTWVWVDSRSWWWTGRPGVLRFMASEGVGHDWVTEMNWILINFFLTTLTFLSLSLPVPQKVLLLFVSF